MNDEMLKKKLRQVRELEAGSKDHIEEMYRRPGHQARRAAILELMSRHVAGKDFAEIGCAEGIYCDDAARLKAKSLVGLDISSKKIARARELYPHLEFMVGDIEEFARTSGRKFDFILLTEVLQHVVNYKSAISGVLSLLRPTGLLLISVPNLSKSARNEFAEIDDTMTVDQLLNEIGGAGHGKQNAVWKFNTETFKNELVASFPLVLEEEIRIDTPDGQIKNLWTVLLFQKTH